MVSENIETYKDFIVSKNVMDGQPVGYTLREKQDDETLSGWIVLSVEDDERYVQDPNNFTTIDAQTMANYQPLLLEIYHSAYGTELNWLYDEQGVFSGFFDIASNQEVSLAHVLTRGML